jgi:hypothetical protein
MTPQIEAKDPKVAFPYISRSARAFIVPIYPEYHTTLLPDSKNFVLFNVRVRTPLRFASPYKLTRTKTPSSLIL